MVVKPVGKCQRYLTFSNSSGSVKVDYVAVVWAVRGTFPQEGIFNPFKLILFTSEA
jgi:hypothetical protein